MGGWAVSDVGVALNDRTDQSEEVYASFGSDSAIGTGNVSTIALVNGTPTSGQSLGSILHQTCAGGACTSNCYVGSLSGGGSGATVTITANRQYYNCNCNCRC